MTLKQIEKDFHLLFTTGKDYFQPIDGLRSLSCLMIITVHLIISLNVFIPAYPHPEWITYIKSLSFSSIPLLGYALETFFLLSGFLLTNKFIHQWNQVTSPKIFFKQYAIDIFRRTCRYWPGFLLISLVMFLLGEPDGNYLSMWLFFQNYVSMDEWSIGMSPLWSVSLDMQVHILLPLLLYLIYSYRHVISIETSLYLLVFFSIIYSLLIFNPNTMDIIKVSSRYNTLTLLMSEPFDRWIQSTYNVTFPIAQLYPNPVKLYMEQLYFPLLGRYSSFIVGSILAVKINNVKPGSSTNVDTIKKYIYFTLIGFYFLVLVLPPPLPKEEQTSIDKIILTVFICCSRQIFATCQSFLLFSALTPSTHPYHSSLMRKILSLQFWSPIAKLSYFVYVLHFRISFELIMDTKLFDFHRHFIGYSIIIHLIVVFIICLLFAGIWHLFVERPFERFINRILTNKFRKE